ncbi:MAG: hypothetical protein EBS32_05175 [Actinobacteria bacterium]|nr:hypothetical protein [Actinomycetota bacterium]
MVVHPEHTAQTARQHVVVELCHRTAPGRSSHAAAQRFVVERASAPNAAVWSPVSDPLEVREFRGAVPSGGNAFYRIRSVPVL